MKKDEVLKKLLMLSETEIPNRNFEERVMEKIRYVAIQNLQRKHHLRLSWIFLVISTILLPSLFLTFINFTNLNLLTRLVPNLIPPVNILLPAGIVIAAIIILLQIDNLLRLSLQSKY